MTAADEGQLKLVKVGMRVRVLVVPDAAFLGHLPEDERDQVNSMLGEVFEVEEIDDYGLPWVTKWFGDEKYPVGQSLALGGGEFEIVD